MSTNIFTRAENLKRQYYEQIERNQPKISALKAKIREIESQAKVDGDELYEVLQRLKKLSNPDRIDGNGMRVGYHGTAQYVRTFNDLKELPATPRTKQKAKPSGIDQSLAEIDSLIESAFFTDERAQDVVRIIKRKLADKTISLLDAKSILDLFLFEEPGSEGRLSGESRLEACQYTR